jgi:hypothetical protein
LGTRRDEFGTTTVNPSTVGVANRLNNSHRAPFGYRDSHFEHGIMTGHWGAFGFERLDNDADRQAVPEIVEVLTAFPRASRRLDLP